MIIEKVAKPARPEQPPQPADVAWQAAAQCVQAAAGAEETRFNNLNSRAISLLSATSLITAQIGLFSKDLFADSMKPVHNSVAILAGLAVIALAVAVGYLLIGVLLPRRRKSFGGNAVTDGGNLQSDTDVYRIVWDEYRQIQRALLDRNDSKAAALHVAYSVYSAAVGFGILLVLRLVMLALYPSAHAVGF
jgi:hypothetical protein